MDLKVGATYLFPVQKRSATRRSHFGPELARNAYPQRLAVTAQERTGKNQPDPPSPPPSHSSCGTARRTDPEGSCVSISTRHLRRRLKS